MYDKFKYDRVALSLIRLDDRNPRIVTPERLTSEADIAAYFFEHEDLASFIKMVASEGRNPGAERPYVVKEGKSYVVIEGNTRIGTYKLLTGLLAAPTSFQAAVPLVSEAMKQALLSVDVTIAPSRDSLMTIMARAHFGRGDKNGWRYLGSRKALFDDWRDGKSIPQLSHVFGRTQSQIRELLLEFMLYQAALELPWTAAEREHLLKPSLEFNPPVRFLQTLGHKQLVGIELDRVNLKVTFSGADAKAKFKHLVQRTVIDDKGPSATASYDEVFATFVDPTAKPKASDGKSDEEGIGEAADGSGQGDGNKSDESGEKSGGSGQAGPKHDPAKAHALFSYPVERNDLTLSQYMDEARRLSTKAYPAAASALLRGLVEVLLKLMIAEHGLNKDGNLLDLEMSLNLLIGSRKLSADDVRILKEFKNRHVNYMNLSSHATIRPNQHLLLAARDTIHAFIKRNV